LIFGLPFEAAPPLRAISERRSGLKAFARALAAFHAFPDRRLGVRGFRFAFAAAISIRWAIFKLRFADTSAPLRV
jgi:hypothetical protein